MIKDGKRKNPNRVVKFRVDCNCSYAANAADGPVPPSKRIKEVMMDGAGFVRVVQERRKADR